MAPTQERDPLEQVAVRHKTANKSDPVGYVPFQALDHWKDKGFVEVKDDAGTAAGSAETTSK